MPLPAPALELFARQHGLLARIQARAALSDRERRTLYRHPDVEVASPRVLRHRAAPVSLGSRLGVAALDALPDACLWERSAALWWGFGRERSPLVHVARRGRPAQNAVGAVHQIDDLDPIDVVRHDGLLVARPERTILSLAATETRKYRPGRLRDRRHGEDLLLLAPVVAKIGRVLDHAWAMGLVDGHFVHDLVTRLAVQGRSGIVALRAALETRPPDHRPPESGLETRFEEIVGPLVEQLRRQVVVEDASGPIARVDYLARRWPLVIEINGEFSHVGPSDRERDDRRHSRLLDAGYSVLVLWQYDIWQTPAVVQPIVRRLLHHPDERPTLHTPTTPPWELLPPSRASVTRNHH